MEYMEMEMNTAGIRIQLSIIQWNWSNSDLQFNYWRVCSHLNDNLELLNRRVQCMGEKF